MRLLEEHGHDRISEFGDRARVYGTGFVLGFLARIGVRDRTWRLGIEVGSDDLRRMTECG
jgi:hypothetical protein